jgi:hypothetical protein
MAHHRRLIADFITGLFAGLATGMFVVSSALATQLVPPKPMQGPEIIATFEGKTVHGVYADGTPVRETYAIGGNINYWDPVYGHRSGKWSVVNHLFCTFYEDMAGACFRIERVSENCFDYLAEASSEQEALTPPGMRRYTARASVEGRRPTCPDELVT